MKTKDQKKNQEKVECPVCFCKVEKGDLQNHIYRGCRDTVPNYRKNPGFKRDCEQVLQIVEEINNLRGTATHKYCQDETVTYRKTKDSHGDIHVHVKFESGETTSMSEQRFEELFTEETI